ncbi:MAG: hypothetical protein IKE22_01920, partial [Atopobiaceae bacterium]|nr:hypothetical protein [Atopobiaceae bacterium]
ALVAVALAVSCLGPTPVYAASSPEKTETVHVQTDATGAVTEVTVEVLLANGAKVLTVPDRTTLTDIKPSDEDKSFTDSGDGSLLWTADGKQVTYKGTSSNTPPVEIKLSYQLDGVEVAPSELAGASGHLKLRVDYRNTSSSQQAVAGKAREVYTPFICMTIVTLDDEVARNVTVTNGSVMEDKGGCAVVGYAMPGLKESLDLDVDGLDLDLPTSVEIEADVTDFELDSIYTMVTAEPFEDLDTSDLNNRDTSEGTGALRDAMCQLIDGSGSLTDALNQLAQGGCTLSAGAGALREALGALPTGMAELKTGAQTLSDQLGEAGGVTEGLAQASSGVASTATQVSQKLDTASESIAQAQQSVSDLRDGVDALGLDEAQAEMTAAEQAAQDAQAAAEDANDLLGQVADDIDDANTQKAAVAQGLQDARDALDLILSDETLNLTKEKREQLSQQIAAIQTQIDNLNAIDVSVPDELSDVATTLSDDASALGEHAAALETMTLDVTNVSEGAENALSSLDEAAATVGSAQEALVPVSMGAQSVSEGLTAVTTGLSAAQGAASTLAGALDAMATQAPQALSGIDALQTGINQLAAGTSAAAQGSSALTDALATLDREGIAKIADALAELGNNIDDVSGSLDALRAAAREYDNFSGKIPGQSSSVRFIYQTERIGM